MHSVSWKKPLILATILAIGGGLVYWQEYNRRPKKEEADENSKKPFVLKERQIAEIRLLGSDDKKRYAFRCVDLAAKLCKPGDQSKWELIEPIRGLADAANVNALLSTLNNTTASQTIDLSTDSSERRASLLTDYGLASAEIMKPAFRRIELKFDDGKIQIAYLGGTNPLDQGVFTVTARDGIVQNEKVFVLPSFFMANVENPLSHWRDKKLVSLEPAKITGFTLKGTRETVQAKKAENGQWSLSSSKLKGDYPGDLENVDGFVTTVGYLAARDFVQRTELVGAKSILEISFQGADPFTVKLYEKTGKATDPKRAFATLSRTDTVYEIEPSTLTRLDKGLKDLRLTRFISSLDRFAIKKIEVSGKEISPSLLVTQSSEKWELADSAAPKKTRLADQEKVLALLDKISGNRVQDFVEGAKIPIGEGEGIELLFSDSQGQKKRHLRFWTRDFKLYARDLDSKRNEAFLVDTALSIALPWRRDSFDVRAATPAPAPSAATP